MSGRRRPAAFDIEEAEFVGGSEAAGRDPFEEETADGTDEVAADPALARRRRGVRWSALLAAGVSGLVSIAIAFSVQRMISELFARFPVLGWVALALAILAALGFAGLMIRELVGLFLIRRIERLRRRAADALADDDRKAALSVLGELIALYEGRPTTARGRNALRQHMGEIIDGRDLIELAEHEILAPLDREAVRLVVASAKRVAAVTALSPRALVDLAYVAIEALGLVRRLALVYGGRPGTLGFLRVTRHAVAHLAVTGGMAAGDSLIHEVVGRSLASRLSARLGEGVVNGLMTARLGLATIDVIRPLPFSGVRRPRVNDVVGELAKLAPGAGAKGEAKRA